MKNVVEDFIKILIKLILTKKIGISDAWDHIAVRLSQQQSKNRDFGISFDDGLINIDKINDHLKSKHKVHFSS